MGYKNAIFRPKFRYISELVQDRDTVTASRISRLRYLSMVNRTMSQMETKRKVYEVNRKLSQTPDVSIQRMLCRPGHRGRPFFNQSSSTYDRSTTQSDTEIADR